MAAEPRSASHHGSGSRTATTPHRPLAGQLQHAEAEADDDHLHEERQDVSRADGCLKSSFMPASPGVPGTAEQILATIVRRGALIKNVAIEVTEDRPIANNAMLRQPAGVLT